MLPHKMLGSTGISVSALGLGTVKFGRNEGVKYPTSFKIPEMKYLKEYLAFAQSLGINLLDTAPAYGSSEERLGELLKGTRDQWVLCSKAGEEFVDGASHYYFDAYHLEQSLLRSLKRLKTDYLDILLIHSNGNDLSIMEEYDVFTTLAQFKQRGLIRAFGMSTKTLQGGLKALKGADVLMVEFSPVHREEEAVLDQALITHKGILVKKALASGHLAKVAQVLGVKTPAQVVQASMNLVFQKPAVGSVIVGTINPKHLRENVQAVVNATGGGVL
jgi:aryl-alcohol dehydrogenase-like predicted oxidoreductase